MRYLRLHGTECWGWDPVHLPGGSRSSAQVVNLGYVVNVIEDTDERARCLACAWACAARVLIVSARLASQTQDFTPVGRYADGFVTSVPTFQKLYSQNELKEWIEAQLGETAVAGGPGTFYVFRDTADRVGYLASRFRSSSDSPTSVASSIDAHKELVRPLITFFHAHGRVPVDDEISNAAEIRERLGSLRRALRLIQRGHDPDQWHRIISARGHDLLLFLALSRFDGRPRFGQLPLTLRRDIKGLFPSYRQACAEADVALHAVGDLGRISRAAERSPRRQTNSRRPLRPRKRPQCASSTATALRRMCTQLHRPSRRRELDQAPHRGADDLLSVIPELRIRPPSIACRDYNRPPTDLSGSGAALRYVPEPADSAQKGAFPAPR